VSQNPQSMCVVNDPGPNTEFQVRAVALPYPHLAITASRDGTTKLWKQENKNPPTFGSTESSHGAAYKTCVAVAGPTKEYPDGLVISGGQDTIIEARQPASTAESSADGLMVGHTNQVASLDVNMDEGWIVSGSWDGTAKLWRLGQWQPEVDFPGHQGTVWAVVAYSNDIVVTGMSCKFSRTV
jgi:phospholipase A-2-activating protein